METTKYKKKFFADSVSRTSVLIVLLLLIAEQICSSLKAPSWILFILIFMVFTVLLVAIISAALSFVIGWQLPKVNFNAAQLGTKKQDELWEERNEQGRCGSCNSEFTENNPDFGGGQCRNCWASWG